jgi:hypothetical protein
VANVIQYGKELVRNSITVLFLFVTYCAFGQFGGKEIFTFLNTPASARTTALGGYQIGVFDSDQNLALNNPAQLNEEMHQSLSFNHHFHYSGIQNGFASYAHHAKKINLTVHGGIQYINYGDFVLADDRGNVEGEFKASELALVVGGGRKINERMHVGANLKFVTSNLESYNSTGLVVDLGGTYQNADGSAIFSIVLKNMGGQLSTYYEGGENEPVPFDLQFGISKRLKYLPFRFSVIAHNMHRWNLLYDSPISTEQATLIGEEQNEPSAFSERVDNFFRHLVFNGEFLLGKAENFQLRFGYNHRRKKEMSVPNARSLAGFSMGFGFKVSHFKLDYGMGIHHIVGSVKHIGISTNLSRFGKKEML